MQRQYTCLKAVVWLVCVYHVTLGIVLNAPVGIISSTLTQCLGATKMPDASSLFAARMLGTYMLVFGIGMGIAAWNPVKNRALLTVGVLLVTGRALQRLYQADDLYQALGVSPAANWATIAVLMGIAGALAFFRFKLWQALKAEERS
jgi:hypothetical protein